MRRILPPNEAEEIPLPRPFVSKDKKLVRVGVPADGNCFFHAVMRACNIDHQITAEKFRECLVNVYMEYHKEHKLQDLMDVEEARFDLQTPGRWVDERYADCIGKTLKVKIAILTTNSVGQTVQIPGTRICGCDESKEVILLYFVPKLHHYEYVCLIHEGNVHSTFPDDHTIFTRGFSR
jgi:hypothetical protein